MHYYTDVLKKYTEFKGRATRTEYWTYVLVSIVIYAILGLVYYYAGIVGGILFALYALATLLPTVGVAIRRLHDANFSGWWLLINIIPYVGGIVYLVFVLLNGTPGDNKYGPNPRGQSAAQPAATPPATTN